MKVIVLGGGVIGVSTAYFLSKNGHEVTIIDRQAHAGAETSFANGGQISVCHAEPWANPNAPLKVLKWMMQKDAPLLFRPKADLRQLLWGMQFMVECLPSRTRHNIEQIVRLGTYSRQTLQELRQETNIHYDERTQGILHFYTDQKELDASRQATEVMRALGCDRRMLSVEEALKIEPALNHISGQLKGATYTGEDESGDANKFTTELFKLCQAAGVTALMDHTITSIRADQGKVDHIEVIDSNGLYRYLKADGYVLSLGSFSPIHAAPLGIRLPIYPAKGYSVTIPVKDQSQAYQVSLTDDEYKLVYSRLGDRLRVAGTAEISGYDRALNEVRCQAILKRCQQLFPDAGHYEKASFWSGLRPTTPSNVPLIGRSKLPNLFLNTGHGTLGWTHACGSAKSIARIINGQKPEIEFDFM